MSETNDHKGPSMGDPEYVAQAESFANFEGGHMPAQPWTHVVSPKTFAPASRTPAQIAADSQNNTKTNPGSGRHGCC